MQSLLRVVAGFSEAFFHASVFSSVFLLSTAPIAIPRLHPIIDAAIKQFARRRRSLLLLRGAAAGVIVLATGVIAIMVVDAVVMIADAQRWALSAMAYAACLYAAWQFGWRQMAASPRQIAEEIQFSRPSLNDDIVSAIELANPSDGRHISDSNSFRQRTQQRTAGLIGRVDVDEALPWRLVRNWVRPAVVVFLFFSVASVVSPEQFGRRVARAMLPGVPIARASFTTIQIVQPTPPSRTVAIGDSVAIVARLQRLGESLVQLQWEDSNGERQFSSMSTRSIDVGQSTTFLDQKTSVQKQLRQTSGDRENLFAANLAVQSTPIRYRVVGGDAATLWQTLTPVARPRVIEIRKRYRYPDYARIPDQIVESVETEGAAVDGDLAAFAGTIATVSLRFDAPIRDAVLRRGSRSDSKSVKLVDSQCVEFDIPILTPTTYSVDATAVVSGLNQPFAPEYRVTPLRDQPPSARWIWDSPNSPNSDSQPPANDESADLSLDDRSHPLDGQIVGALEVLHLNAIAEDDLPIDRIVQEIQINNDPLFVRPLDVAEANQRVDASWDLDLTALRGSTDVNPEKFRPLKPGDIVRFRVVAVDRLGQRGESNFIEVLIADEGFDAQRNRKWLERSDRIVDWLQYIAAKKSLLQRAEVAIAEPSGKTIDAFLDQWEQLADGEIQIESVMQTLVQNAPSQWHSHQDRTLSCQMDQAEHDADSMLQQVQQFIDKTEGGSLPEQDSNRFQSEQKRLFSNLRSVARGYDPVDESLRQFLTIGIGEVRIDDAVRLIDSIQPLVRYYHDRPVGVTSPLPIERYPRYVSLAMTRLFDLAQLGQQFSPYLSAAVLRQMEDFDSFVETWNTDLRGAVDNLAKPEALRSLVLQFEIQLRQKMVDSLTHVETPGLLSRSLLNGERKFVKISDQILAAAKIGDQSNKAWLNSRQTDAEDLRAQLVESATESGNQYTDAVAEMTRRLDIDAARAREQPTVDLVANADLMLLRRALQNVSRDGFDNMEIGSKSVDAEVVHQEISTAAQWLAMRGELVAWQFILSELARGERDLPLGGALKLIQPQRVDDFLTLVPASLQPLAQLDPKSARTKSLTNVLYDENAQVLRTTISARRWSMVQPRNEEIIRSTSSAFRAANRLRRETMAFENEFAAARATLQKYVETLSDQARRAALAANQAKQSRDPQDAIEMSAQTMQSLIDQANTADAANQSSEIRVADAASALIGQARRDVLKSQSAVEKMESNADAAPSKLNETNQALTESLDELADQLNRVAEALDPNAPSSEQDSRRQSMQQDASELAAEKAIEKARLAAEIAAANFNESPDDVLAQLEKRLQNDGAMRDELSRISQSAIDAAADSFDDAAKRQRQLRQALENGDEDLIDQKIAMGDELRAIGQVAQAAGDILLGQAQQAANRQRQVDPTNDDNAPVQKSLRAIGQARSEVGKAIAAINQINDEKSLAEVFADVTQKVTQSLEVAQAQAAVAAEKSSELANEPGSEQQPQRIEQTRRDMQQVIRSALTQQSRALQSQRDRWKKTARELNQKKRDVQKKIDSLEREQRRQERDFEQETAKGDDDRMKKLADSLLDIKQDLQFNRQKENQFNSISAEATQRSEAAEKLRKQLLARELPSLESEQPAAQTAGLLANSAAVQLDKLAKQAAKLGSQISDDLKPSITPDATKSAQLLSDQSSIASVAGDAIADLQRASRHERRMQRLPSSSRLAKAADDAAEATRTPIDDALNVFEQLLNAQQLAAPEIGVAESTKDVELALIDAANSIRTGQDNADVSASNKTDTSQTPNRQSQSENATASKDSARQLDELDRAIADLERQQNSGASDGNDGSTASSDAMEPADSQQPSDKDSGSNPSDSGQASPSSPEEQSAPSAGQASATMQRLMQQKLQLAAQQRQQRMDDSPSTQGNNAGEESAEAPKSEIADAAQSKADGKTQTADGGSVSIENVDRNGSQWGGLRTLRGDDADSASSSSIPSAYRRALEAYFQAVAQESAKADSR